MESHCYTALYKRCGLRGWLEEERDRAKGLGWEKRELWFVWLEMYQGGLLAGLAEPHNSTPYVMQIEE